MLNITNKKNKKKKAGCPTQVNNLTVLCTVWIKTNVRGGFPGGAVVENLPANAGDTGSSPGLGRSHMLRSN